MRCNENDVLQFQYMQINNISVTAPHRKKNKTESGEKISELDSEVIRYEVTEFGFICLFWLQVCIRLVHY